MRKIKKNIILIIVFTIVGVAINTNVHATGIGMSISKSSAYVGDTFSVTISGINGKVTISGNSNISLSTSGTQWVDGSMTITGTAKSVGTGTITVTPIDVSTTDANPVEVTTSASKSIQITEKPTTTTTTTSTSQSTTSGTSTTTKKSTNTSTSTNKTATEAKTTETEQNTTEDFQISSITLKGIKENGEEVSLELSPEFNGSVYEYTCNVDADVKSIELQKDAGEYTDSIIVTGLEELQEGENIITLQLSAENHEAKIYTIKVIKSAQEIVETSAKIDENSDDEESKTIMICMPLWAFIAMQAGIIVIEVLIICFIPWKKLFKSRKINIDIEE